MRCSSKPSIRPTVNFDRLEVVLVITNFQPLPGEPANRKRGVSGMAKRAEAGTIRQASLYLMAAVLALVVLVQATLLARVQVCGASPNLLLVVVVCWSLLHPWPHDGLVWGFVGGLALDVIAGLPLGTSSLALMATTPSWPGWGRTASFRSQSLLPMLLVALATPVYGWICPAERDDRGIPVDWLASTVRIIGPRSCSTCCWWSSSIRLALASGADRPVQMEW